MGHFWKLVEEESENTRKHIISQTQHLNNKKKCHHFVMQ